MELSWNCQVINLSFQIKSHKKSCILMLHHSYITFHKTLSPQGTTVTETFRPKTQLLNTHMLEVVLCG